MKTKSYFYGTVLLSIFVLICTSCAPSTPPTEPALPDATSTLPDEEPTTQLEATATKAQQNTQEPEPPTVAPTTGPLCTVLQDLNLRSGPGTAYNPPITALPANTEVIPISYNPVGYPGGSWVQVQDPASQKEGWVSAGLAYVSCNLDLTTLSSVAVEPPQPRRPNARSSNEDGTCRSGAFYDCDVLFSDGFPTQFIVLLDRQEIGSAEGVESVSFRVDQNGNTIYSNTEETGAYCMFGGDGPCNSWVLEDYVYKWESGGTPIEPGEYEVNIDAVATINGEFVDFHWEAIVTISLE